MKHGANMYKGIDEHIKETFKNQTSQVSASSEMKWKIDESIRKSEYREVVKMKKWSIKKKLGL